MQIDFNTIWMAVTGLAMPVITLVIGLLYKSRREDALALWNAIKKQAEDVTNFRIHVAENYVTIPRLEKLETSMQDALKRIEDKIDHIRANKG